MTPQGKKIWDSKAGTSLLGRMLNGQPKTQMDKVLINQLKKRALMQELMDMAKGSS